MSQILGATRFMIFLAVLGALIAAATVLIYGLVQSVLVVLATLEAGFATRSGAKVLVIEFIEIVDLFLLGTVFLIISVGLYSLFIDADVPLPAWLEIKTLDDLKSKLVGVVIVVLAVLFLGQVVSWDGEQDLLGYGVAVALVIAALTYFLGLKLSAKAESDGKHSGS